MLYGPLFHRSGLVIGTDYGMLTVCCAVSSMAGLL
jgi:hypothetical protein